MSGPSAAVAVSAAVATVCLVLAASSCSTGTGSDAPGLPPSGGVDYQLGGAYEPSAGTAVVVRDATAEAPAGGVSSTANDMTKWMAMVLGDGSANGQQIVEPKALLDALTPQSVSSPP